jgi:hypothetical protein
MHSTKKANTATLLLTQHPNKQHNVGEKQPSNNNNNNNNNNKTETKFFVTRN